MEILLLSKNDLEFIWVDILPKDGVNYFKY